ncbi:NADH dehydrogenase [ubiquinone] 1 beta subcomplex subunit 7-like [Echinops telfairi]|uniref:NADH dehydrogenase [ubiquinone] 1 beta subcomplex subunit 7-like n=1 Tax=Echinops telfairi TaxID=9371 RepID=A0AC55CZI5_ECHTE|nr:NADH dehydrogenase [ubiquinone] 1 beta subcomplex subunit 7-like [Echinops telfairi]
MGAHLVQWYLGEASVEPDPLQMPTFRPDSGFPGPKVRDKVTTQQQMTNAQLMLHQRDYCAHHLLRLLKCKRDSFPNILGCKHEQHACDYCEHDYVSRMKEFERERRLLKQKQQREKREAATARGQGEGEVATEVAL